MRILIVEDETKMAALLKRGLEEEGYAVDVAATGTDGLWAGTENPYDAIVLDVMLPELDGFAVCRELRARGRWAPVLMLTARDDVRDRVEGLDAGADDYLVKPFAFSELVARVRALIRRGAGERPAVLASDDLVLDPASRRVPRGDVEISLTSEGVRAARALPPPSGRGAVADPDPRARVGLRLQQRLERRRRLRPLPAREGRPALRPRLDRDGARVRLSPSRGFGMRVPIRLRLTLISAGLMAAVLVALAAFLVTRLEADLIATVDAGLRSRASVLLDRIGEGGGVSSSNLTEGDEAFAQLLASDGSIIASSRGVTDPILSSDEVSAVETRRLPRPDRRHGRGAGGRPAPRHPHRRRRCPRGRRLAGGPARCDRGP